MDWLGNMAAGQHSPPSSRSVEKTLEDAQSTGQIDLSNRKLQEFPKCSANYDLIDTVEASKCQFLDILVFESRLQSLSSDSILETLTHHFYLT